MNGVAVIDRVTIDCIFSGMAGFPGAGEELYTDRFSMTLGGGALEACDYTVIAPA